MSGGAHGLQPSGHEHVHCRFCGANAVHTVVASDGSVSAGPHPIKGGTEQCLRSRWQPIRTEHRNQGDPR